MHPAAFDLVDLMALRQAGAMTESKPKVSPTEARRKASAAYHEKRKASGMKKVTVWLSADAQAALERMKDQHGSKDAVIETLLTTPRLP